MQSEAFFATHPVFTADEFVLARASMRRALSTAKNLLVKHCAAGRIVRIRRGLYATVPAGVAPSQAAVDPYLVGSKLADDAVIAYHAALQFHGKSYSVWRRFVYLTDRQRRPFSFAGDEFVPVSTPASLRARSDRGGGIGTAAHAGGEVRVTTLERTLVDVLDAPGRSGGWEEAWRSLEMVEFFDIGAVVEYAARLGSAVTAARVGFFLEQHREELIIEDEGLGELWRLRPRQPRYFDAARSNGRLMAAWNLIVPTDIIERRWEETA